MLQEGTRCTAGVQGQNSLGKEFGSLSRLSPWGPVFRGGEEGCSPPRSLTVDAKGVELSITGNP